MFYAQSTGAVISGRKEKQIKKERKRERERTHEIWSIYKLVSVNYIQQTATLVKGGNAWWSGGGGGGGGWVNEGRAEGLISHIWSHFWISCCKSGSCLGGTAARELMMTMVVSPLVVDMKNGVTLFNSASEMLS